MSIRKYYATQDTTITNAFKTDLVTRGTNANMGASDILEVFSIYGQTTSSAGYSNEKSRVLMQFDVNQVIADRSAGIIPASGSISFLLNLYNAKHVYDTPKNFKLIVAPISRSWSEGEGLDMEGYTDVDYSNWQSASSTTAWTSPGGDYITSSVYQQTFDIGTENLKVDITPLVEQWIAGTTPNYGIGIYLTSSQESSTEKSYYTKRFFARKSQFFFERPTLEAKFNDSKKDNRGNFYYSSSLLTAQENSQTLYFYNYYRGNLRNIPDVGTGPIYINLYSGSTGPTGSALQTTITGGWASTGIYTASFSLNKPNPVLETIYDVWFYGGTQYYTGSFNPIVLSPSQHTDDSKYITKITNLKEIYYPDDEPVLRLYARPRNWYPNIYTTAQDTPDTSTIESASYSVFRNIDNRRVIEHGTGSYKETLMSYDEMGNYFKFDMSLLEPDYSYSFEIAIYNDNSKAWDIQPETFKFRVENRKTE